MLGSNVSDQTKMESSMLNNTQASQNFKEAGGIPTEQLFFPYKQEIPAWVSAEK